MSAATITKRADDLCEGDIINPGKGYHRLVVLEAKTDAEFEAVEMQTYNLNERKMQKHRTPRDAQYQIESAFGLTPAQQHADEMLDLLLRAAPRLASDLHDPITALAEKLLPPAPPTLEEALETIAMLAPMCEGHATQKAFDMLDRARRAGVLPK